MLKSLVIKFLRARWGSLLPQVFKAAAEGSFGPAVAKVYWWLAGSKTIIGAVLWGAGAALETICGQYPQYGWACEWAKWPYYVGMFLTGVGLADGGTRSPWPKGADIPADAKN